MTTHKRKKLTRYRGFQTHGGGAKKKRRGAGHRGGRGNAGSGKRSDAKKPSFNEQEHFGKHGFFHKNEKINVVNVGHLDDTVDSYVQAGVFSQKAGVYDVDLSKIDIQKLLSTGSVTRKLNITVKYATPAAIEKVKTKGGSVTVSAKAE